MAISKELMKITADMQKKFDKAMVAIASQAEDRELISHSTGCLNLDLVLGKNDRAGLVEGRLYEFYGPESSGKTTTALLAVAARQKEEDLRESMDPTYQKKTCIYFDAERAIDLRIAEEYGVNLDELILINPETAEDGMDVLDLYINTGQIALVVIDSVPSLIPSAQMDASYNQQFMGLLARFMSGVCQKMVSVAGRHKTTIIFINQIREKIGGWSPTGVPTTTPGGRALKFYSSVRLEIRQGERLKRGDEVVGHELLYRNIKNKLGMPYRTCKVELIYGQGIDRANELFQIALKSGDIRQGGAWFTYLSDDGEIVSYNGQEMRFQGREKCIDAIRNIPMFFGDLESRIRGVDVDADVLSEEEILAIKQSEKEAKVIDDTLESTPIPVKKSKKKEKEA